LILKGELLVSGRVSTFDKSPAEREDQDNEMLVAMALGGIDLVKL